MARQLILLVDDDATLARQWEYFPTLKSAVWIGGVLPHFSAQPHFPFSKSKNLLGSEFPALIYDGRQGIHLDALAIAAGALAEGGALLMLLNHWHDLAAQLDGDSLRWSGEKHPINTPHFIAFLQEKIQKYGFPIYQYLPPALVFPKIETSLSKPHQPTLEQAHLLRQMATSGAEMLIVTAKRGRGKSALAGLFAKQQLEANQPVLLTAPNKSAVKILNEFAAAEIPFMPPDELRRKIDKDLRPFSDHWLFVDEAAMIPLDTLLGLTTAFKRIVLTTTIHS